MNTIFSGKHVLVAERDGWEFVERRRGKSAVAIIAVTDDGRLVLTEQLRRPVDARVIDLPAGLVGDEDDSADVESTARKELEEETGYACERVEVLFTAPTSPGITSETVTVVRAHGVRKTGEGGGVGGEDITVHLVPVAELESWLDGKVVDLKVWAAIFFISKSS